MSVCVPEYTRQIRMVSIRWPAGSCQRVRDSEALQRIPAAQAGVDLGKELINCKQHQLTKRITYVNLLYQLVVCCLLFFKVFLQLTLGSRNGSIPINKLLER